MTRFERLGPRPGTLASAVMLVAIHPPIELEMLVWIALVPWIGVVARSAKTGGAVVQAFWLELLVGFGWGWWLPEAVADFFHVPIWTGVVVLAVNATIHHLHLLPFAWCLWKASGHLASVHGVATALLVLPATYCAFDWLLPGIFQHGLGAALHDLPRVRQLAAIGGVPLLTYLVVFVNLALAVAIRAVFEHGRPWRGRIRRGGVAVAMATASIMAALLYGEHRGGTLSAALDQASTTMRIAIVQGNVDGETKRRWRRGDLAAAQSALATYVRESRELLSLQPRPELVVWPETAYPGIYRRPENEAQARLNASFDRFIHEMDVPFVFGAYDREERIDQRILRNALFVVQARPDQPRTVLSPAQRYVKSILFPLGETLPWISEARAHAWLSPSARFASGEGPAVLSVRRPADGTTLRIGPLICYEDLFVDHVAALERLGAEMLINISNDAWFGDRGEPRLHLIYARLRSVELGLPQVRATNTGYSAAILPNGDLRAVTAFGERVSRVVMLPILDRTHRTLIARWGDWFGGACLAITLLAATVDAVRRFAGRAANASKASPP